MTSTVPEFKINLFTVGPIPLDKPWIGYARVSTKRQHERGISIEDQEQEIIAYCTKLGIPLAGVVNEIASSKNINERPQMKTVLYDISQNKYAGVISVDMSRLTRNVIDQQVFIDPIGKAARIKLTRHEYRNASSDDYLANTFNAVIDHSQRLRTSIATKKALEAHRQQRYYTRTGYGVPPYVYRLEDLPNGKQKMHIDDKYKFDYLLNRYLATLGLHIDLCDALTFMMSEKGIGNITGRRCEGRFTLHIALYFELLPKEEEHWCFRVRKYDYRQCYDAYDKVIEQLKLDGRESEAWKVPVPETRNIIIKHSKTSRKARANSEDTPWRNQVVAWDKVIEELPQALLDAFMPYYLITNIAQCARKYKKAASEAIALRPISAKYAAAGMSRVSVPRSPQS